MDQMAIDSTRVTLERNQSILIKEILGKVASWFGGLFLQVVTSNFSLHLLQWIVQCTLLNWKKRKYVFQQDNIRIHGSRPSEEWFHNQLLRFYCDQLALLTWILLKMFREFLSEEYIEITDNLPVLKILN